MAIIIKKKVDLGFLGDEYKDSYLEFKQIPVDDIEENEAERQKALKEDGAVDNILATKHVLNILKKYFVGGKFKGEEVTERDLGQFDDTVLLHCVEVINGTIDPKGETQSTNSSPTGELPPPST